MTKINLEEMTDIVGGKMTLQQLNEEIKFLMKIYSPEKVIIDIRKKGYGYYTLIYIPTKDFERK